MKSFDTVVDALNDLKSRGYDHDFNIKEDCLECAPAGLKLDPDEFEITEVYRFEGQTDPADEAVVYAIESHHGIRGTLVNAYGHYGESISQDLIKKLDVKH